MSLPFFRYVAIMGAMRAMLAQGIPLIDAQIRSGASGYHSRGKGGSHSKPGKTYHGGNTPYPPYPFSSTRQDQRCATRQVTRFVNGFPPMQTLPATNKFRHAI